jgi:FeS assembly SUF system protein
MDEEIKTTDTVSKEPWEDHQEPGEFGELNGLVAKSGVPKETGTAPSREGVVEALKTVYDPEIPVDIYELGLVYEIDITDTGNMKITMTLTAPGCPVAGILPQQVADAAASVTETGEVEVYLVWDPPWDMEKMSEEARLALDLF